jgi:hypothetical protein
LASAAQGTSDVADDDAEQDAGDGPQAVAALDDNEDAVPQPGTSSTV